MMNVLMHITVLKGRYGLPEQIENTRMPHTLSVIWPADRPTEFASRERIEMDWKRFVASLVSSLAWPVVAVAFLYLLRDQLPDLLKRLKGVSVGSRSEEHTSEEHTSELQSLR